MNSSTVFLLIACVLAAASAISVDQNAVAHGEATSDSIVDSMHASTIANVQTGTQWGGSRRRRWFSPPPPPRVNCAMSGWSWGRCSKPCGRGTKVGTRRVTRYPRNGGKRCPHNRQTAACNTHACPTRRPTSSPTKSPTRRPTHSPSEFPTRVPTSTPTNPPSHSPTRRPTDEPTTKAPTTNKPSFAPSHTPSHTPSRRPTHSPTDTPTLVPTHSPTEEPSQSPTASPTDSPSTMDPTAAPQRTPTDMPTRAPVEITASPIELATLSPRRAASAGGSSSNLEPVVSILPVVTATTQAVVDLRPLSLPAEPQFQSKTGGCAATFGCIDCLSAQCAWKDKGDGTPSSCVAECAEGDELCISYGDRTVPFNAVSLACGIKPY